MTDTDGKERWSFQKAGTQRDKPLPHCFKEQAADKEQQKYNLEMYRLARVTATTLGADIEEMEREIVTLATSTTMTTADAIYHVASRYLNEADQKEGGGHGEPSESP